MIEYLDEEEYLEDIYGDEIKVGDDYYLFKDKFGFKYLISEKNIMQFAKDELDLKKEER